MKKKYVSPFRPKSIKNVNSSKFMIYTFNAGFKKYNTDLLIIVFNKPSNLSAVFTKSMWPSAAVIWGKKNYKNSNCKVLIINSGNANAGTGKYGLDSIKKYTSFAAKFFNCKTSQVFVASTGIIGQKLNSNFIINKINLIKNLKSKKLLDGAKAIMTTDTFPKIVCENAIINKNKIKIYGIAKGSGMIAPNMGTMLSFIFIETLLPKNILNNLLISNIENTFNSISVDGDMSTNDTVMLFSIGSKKLKKIRKNDQNYKLISNALIKVMTKLAKQIVTDGEGITKLIEVNVINAKSISQAKKIAFSVGESILVKTAIFGKDPNWGRIIMAIGKTKEKIDCNKISIKFGSNLIFSNGKISNRYQNDKVIMYMKNKIIKINININNGNFSKIVWSSDLSKKYVELNSEYPS